MFANNRKTLVKNRYQLKNHPRKNQQKHFGERVDKERGAEIC